MKNLDSLKALNSSVNVLPTGRARDTFSITHVVIFKVFGHH